MLLYPVKSETGLCGSFFLVIFCSQHPPKFIYEFLFMILRSDIKERQWKTRQLLTFVILLLIRLESIRAFQDVKQQYSECQQKDGLQQI